ncbi:hypothetical protein IV77_GL000346 [Olsenella uli DSM 7084]|nr:hypothetical protein IV77_GL000346 [Olsenella uli DSM 7084]
MASPYRRDGRFLERSKRNCERRHACDVHGIRDYMHGGAHEADQMKQGQASPQRVNRAD